MVLDVFNARLEKCVIKPGYYWQRDFKLLALLHVVHRELQQPVLRKELAAHPPPILHVQALLAGVAHNLCKLQEPHDSRAVALRLSIQALGGRRHLQLLRDVLLLLCWWMLLMLLELVLLLQLALVLEKLLLLDGAHLGVLWMLLQGCLVLLPLLGNVLCLQLLLLWSQLRLLGLWLVLLGNVGGHAGTSRRPQRRLWRVMAHASANRRALHGMRSARRHMLLLLLAGVLLGLLLLLTH